MSGKWRLDLRVSERHPTVLQDRQSYVRTQECYRSRPKNCQRLRLPQLVQDTTSSTSDRKAYNRRWKAYNSVNGHGSCKKFKQRLGNREIEDRLLPQNRKEKTVMENGRSIAATKALYVVGNIGGRLRMCKLLFLQGLINDVILGTNYLEKANTTVSCWGQKIRTKTACSTMNVYDG